MWRRQIQTVNKVKEKDLAAVERVHVARSFSRYFYIEGSLRDYCQFSLKKSTMSVAFGGHPLRLLVKQEVH